MLDPSEQTKMIQLLKHVQVERGMAMVFVSHDLAVVRVADRVMVLDRGRVVEEATGTLVSPQHPVTRGLSRPPAGMPSSRPRMAPPLSMPGGDVTRARDGDTSDVSSDSFRQAAFNPEFVRTSDVAPTPVSSPVSVSAVSLSRQQPPAGRRSPPQARGSEIKERSSCPCRPHRWRQARPGRRSVRNGQGAARW